MTEKIKKIFISLSIFLLFSLFSPLHFSLAAPMPSCSISFTPNVIKQGEISIESWQTMGPLDGMSFKCTGILSYMGGYTMDFTDPEFLKNINAQELINGTSNSGQIKPSKIGEGSCTITVWGPGGNNCCSTSIKVVAVDINNGKEQEFVGVLAIPGTLRDCPSKDCDIIRYYSETAQVKITGIDNTNEWYEIIANDDYGNKLNGWMHYSIFTDDYRARIKSNNYKGAETIFIFGQNTKEIILNNEKQLYCEPASNIYSLSTAGPFKPAESTKATVLYQIKNPVGTWFRIAIDKEPITSCISRPIRDEFGFKYWVKKWSISENIRSQILDVEQFSKDSLGSQSFRVDGNYIKENIKECPDDTCKKIWMVGNGGIATVAEKQGDWFRIVI